jgi:hypothetical protein
MIATHTRRAGRATAEEAPRGGLSPLPVLAWSAGGALLLSTGFLAQPFVWRNWPVADVMGGWRHILLDRLVVAAPIGLCVWLASWAPLRRPGLRTAVTAAAVVVGAGLGEALRLALDPFADRSEPLAIAGRVVHWALVSAVAVGILSFWRLHADLATTAAEAGAADARTRQMLLASQLDALQRQIEPHFLFNTLATIKSFGQSARDDGEALLERLFDYLSGIFAAADLEAWSLGAELDLVIAYLDVCAVRMGPRLTVENRIDASLRDLSVPPLMLGTLVENALRHGLSPAPAGGIITLTADRVGRDLEICVADDGVGLANEGGTGIGLANLAQRLALLHGSRAGVRLEPGHPRGVRARLRLPAIPVHALAA